MANDHQTALRTACEQVCNSYQAIADFRAKLLGFLPLVSGTGIFLLLGNRPPEPKTSDQLMSYLGPIGFFGALISLGLFTYELRGIQRCNALIAIGKDIEARLGVAAQFRLRPGSVAGFIDTTLASRIVYSAVLAAWMFVLFQSRGIQSFATAAGVGTFLVSFIGSFFLKSLDVQLEDLLTKQKVDIVLEEVAQSPRQWTGIAVTPDGRVFVNFPRWSDDVPVSVGQLDLRDGSVDPFPSSEWNKWDGGAHGAKSSFVCVQSIVADRVGWSESCLKLLFMIAM